MSSAQQRSQKLPRYTIDERGKGEREDGGREGRGGKEGEGGKEEEVSWGKLHQVELYHSLAYFQC